MLRAAWVISGGGTILRDMTDHAGVARALGDTGVLSSGREIAAVKPIQSTRTVILALAARTERLSRSAPSGDSDARCVAVTVPKDDEMMDITWRRLGSVVILYLNGRWAIGPAEVEVSAFRSTIDRLVVAGRVHLVANLAGLTSMDARGLGELVFVHNALESA